MSTAPLTPSTAVFPAPIFTVGSALRWLGHDCPARRCSEGIDALDASVWFVRHGQRFLTSSPETLVLVDPAVTGAALADLHRVIDAVDGCTRSDGIRVRDVQWLRRNGTEPTIPAGAPVSRPMLGADERGRRLHGE